MSKVYLIFDKKKDGFNWSWFHYLDYPEMKKYLIHVKDENGYKIVDSRTKKTIMSSSSSLKEFLK